MRIECYVVAGERLSYTGKEVEQYREVIISYYKLIQRVRTADCRPKLLDSSSPRWRQESDVI